MVESMKGYDGWQKSATTKTMIVTASWTKAIAKFESAALKRRRMTSVWEACQNAHLFGSVGRQKESATKATRCVVMEAGQTVLDHVLRSLRCVIA
jgi:RecB family endonuclease NucS